MGRTPIPGGITHPPDMASLLSILASLSLITAGPIGVVEDGGATALTHFSQCSHRTGAGATVIIPASAEIITSTGDIEVGDEVAVLAPDGSCVGAGVWNGEGIAVTVWEDDPFTPVLDGLVEGDPLEFATYDASAGIELEGAVVKYEAEFEPREGYDRDALYIVGARSSTADEDGPADGALRLEQNYPNPVRAETTIPFSLEATGTVRLEIYDTLGRLVSAPLHSEAYGPGQHTVQVDAAGLAPGLYVYRLTVDGTAQQRTLTVTR